MKRSTEGETDILIYSYFKVKSPQIVPKASTSRKNLHKSLKVIQMVPRTQN